MTVIRITDQEFHQEKLIRLMNIDICTSASIQTAFFKVSALPDSVLSKYSEKGIQTRRDHEQLLKTDEQAVELTDS